MALISDTDYLIHRLRLTYLREVEDPYGPRVVALDDAHTSNPYILASSLADADKWPELLMPTSPQLSEDEEPAKLGGATKLKYTTTIMGGRTGGLGLRTNGKRLSTSKRASTLGGGTPRPPDATKNLLGASAPVQEHILSEDNDIPDQARSAEPDVNVHVMEPTVVEEAPVAKPPPQFVPRFKMAKEMEKRRMQRMAQRKGLPVQVSFDDSSSEDVESSDDSDFPKQADNDSMDDDEFDPDFAATTTRPSSSASDMDMDSIMSMSDPEDGSPDMRRPRISPVSERTRKMLPKSHSPSKAYETRIRKTSAPPRMLQQSSFANDIFFARRPIAQTVQPQTSALSAMLKTSGTNTNPFSETYASISGRSEGAATVQVFFPHAKEPRGRPMELNIRKDATVEEVVGFALWTYCEEGWLPKLDEGLSGEDDEQWETRMSTIGWIMRITEDDGEIDDDFPPPDRLGKAVKFNADGFAVIEATPAQIAQNRVLEGKIQRRPSRTAKKKPQVQSEKQLSLPTAAGASGPSSAILGSVPLSTSFGLSTYGPQMFLRIRLADAVGPGHVSTTIPVSSEMYMQEALEMVCKKRNVDNPKEWALLLPDRSMVIPLDRTVASLQGKRELIIVRRDMLNPDLLKAPGKTTDPNASIFKRISDTPAADALSSALDFTNAYKKYTISRKMPMLVAKQEKTLAIDPPYIHIMPSTNKGKAAVFDTGKTYSYHIKSIADCQQSTKSSSVFKLVLNRGSGGTKRYDFEADSPKLAGEIVQTVKNMKTAMERTGTLNKSRRSRHVG
ncbi:hypothetical protein CYLTODRAFT_487987 [Cylindrobasidium torrendii FP15055 ss-10]|uniref:SIN1-domain-containing protein n=1 Tax=Cylindrobasidium torrendii FP15055 ss-10 TaxID=1314674 RepID=A0A0D7BK07_9AGAR|nr:hypothetical protein CYLTODRAFT_487987 [Cylindrobasidium torrendii FP15055 ss-10]